MEGSSQTELKHPKNVYTQYEPRVFTDEEVATIWESDEMKKFMTKVQTDSHLDIFAWFTSKSIEHYIAKRLEDIQVWNKSYKD